MTKPDGSTVETTKNPDGSQQVVNTDKDGTVTTTTTDKAGNKSETAEKTDGTSQTTVTNKDGSSSITSVAESGQMEVEVKLPSSVVSSAAEKEEAVVLPMPSVPVTSDRENTPTVTVDLPSGTSTKVEIPVEGVTVGTVAVLVKSDGSEAVIRTSVTTENGVAVILSDGDTVKIVDNSKDFADVSGSYWASEAIDFASSRELLTGKTETVFAPSGTVTRQQVWMILARLSGADPSDMAEAKTWAVENGISDGSTPAASVSRQQLATLLYRYAVQFGYDVSSGEDTNILSYTDAAQLNEYAVPAMQWACGAGIINGTGDGSALSPQGVSTRAQLAVILYRWLA